MECQEFSHQVQEACRHLQLFFLNSWFSGATYRAWLHRGTPSSWLQMWSLSQDSFQHCHQAKACWWKNLVGLKGKNIGSLEAGAKWINTRNDQELKVLLASGAGHRGWHGGLPGQRWLLKSKADTDLVSGNAVSQHGFMCLLHLLQKQFSGHFDRRLPNKKGKQKKCIFYPLQIPTAQGCEWKTLILWPFRPTAGGGEKKKKQNY